MSIPIWAMVVWGLIGLVFAVGFYKNMVYPQHESLRPSSRKRALFEWVAALIALPTLVLAGPLLLPFVAYLVSVGLRARLKCVCGKTLYPDDYDRFWGKFKQAIDEYPACVIALNDAEDELTLRGIGSKREPKEEA